MKAITRDYLTDMIQRCINKTIDVHRKSKKKFFSYDKYPVATDEEVLDFISSIPYFDLRLKDFLVGNLPDETIIISQAWEIEFIKKSQLWAQSYEWVEGNEYYLTDAHIRSLKSDISFLSLPY